MFLLLGVVFLVLGILLVISLKGKREEYNKKLEDISKHNNKKDKKGKSKSDKLQEKAEADFKKAKTNAYSFIAAGICCIIVEITLKFL